MSFCTRLICFPLAFIKFRCHFIHFGQVILHISKESANCVCAFWVRQTNYFLTIFLQITTTLLQRHGVFQLYKLQHFEGSRKNREFPVNILFLHQITKQGIFQGKISYDRQGKMFLGNILVTLKLLPLFLAGCLVAWSPRQDFMKINIYLIQPRRNVLRSSKKLFKKCQKHEFCV